MTSFCAALDVVEYQPKSDAEDVSGSSQGQNIIMLSSLSTYYSLSLLAWPSIAMASVYVTPDLAHLSSSLDLSHLAEGLDQVSKSAKRLTPTSSSLRRDLPSRPSEAFSARPQI